MGIKDSPGGATDWTPRLADLFNARHYTEGLGFVSRGAPSNNTRDAPSGFSSKDPGRQESYLAERAAPAFQPGDGSNADVLTTALERMPCAAHHSTGIAPDLAGNDVPRILTLLLSGWKDAGQLRRSGTAGSSRLDRAFIESPSLGRTNWAIQPDACKP
jgi:hypothetical protein